MSAVRIVTRLEDEGIDVWLDGGWGVDALLERQTGEHDDLDLVVELRHVERVVALFEPLDYELIAGGPPKSFALVDPLGMQIDVHPVTLDDEGGGVYLMDDGSTWVYPALGFSGRGSVAGRPVRCLSPEVQVLVHSGYELSEKDYLELFLLRERFGVEVPAEIAAHLDAAARSATRP